MITHVVPSRCADKVDAPAHGEGWVIEDPIGEAELRLDVIGATIPLGPVYESTTS